MFVYIIFFHLQYKQETSICLAVNNFKQLFNVLLFLLHLSLSCCSIKMMVCSNWMIGSVIELCHYYDVAIQFP